MRVIFSVFGLLVAVAIVGLLAKRQLQALPAGAVSAVSVDGMPAPSPVTTAPRQAGDDVKKALEQGMHRNAGEAEK